MFATSPVEQFEFAGHTLFVKRDDLLHPQFSGNKARKFYHFLINDFPQVKYIVGSGSAQANSLYSLSALANLKGWQLDYYVDHIAGYITQHPKGNYLAALNNGANIIPVSNIDWIDDYADLSLEQKMPHIYQRQYRHLAAGEGILVPEGGRCEFAKTGVYLLGQELMQWAVANKLTELDVFLPSGTGTTSLFLQQYFKQCSDVVDIKVLTCATVGGDVYLKQQFFMLSEDEKDHPRIITNGQNFHFGKLYQQCYDMWRQVCQTGIEFELLYDPVGFIMLQHYLETTAKQTLCQRTVMYIHQGGIKGNETMLPRYKRKFGY